MKKVYLTLVLFLLLLSMTAMVQASAVFEEGDMSPEVAQIQSQLIALGYKPGPADGEFGSMTTTAVIAFQKDRGLEADGVVGPETFRLLVGRDIPVSRGNSVSAVRRLLQTATQYVGVPYMFGGNSPNGFDCSGFTRYVFAKIGISLPRMADEQFELGQPVNKARLQQGDLVYFTTYTSGVSHVGIYLGDGKFISATSSRGVAIDHLENSYWGPRYIGARRV